MKARHSIDAHIATAQFDARTIVNLLKRRTLSMIIDVSGCALHKKKFDGLLSEDDWNDRAGFTCFFLFSFS